MAGVPASLTEELQLDGKAHLPVLQRLKGLVELRLAVLFVSFAPDQHCLQTYPQIVVEVDPLLVVSCLSTELTQINCAVSSLVDAHLNDLPEQNLLDLPHNFFAGFLLG